MKRFTAISTLLTSMVLAPQVSADTLLGVYAGAYQWDMTTEGSISDSANALEFDYLDESQTTFYVALEHFIPLVPNVKVRHNTMETAGLINSSVSYEFNGETFAANTDLTSSLEVTNTDFTLYYEILDFDIASFDVGVNVKVLDGTIAVASDTLQAQPLDFTAPIPMGYAKVEVGLPLTGFGAYVEANLLSLGDHSVYDYQAAVVYKFIDNIAVDLEAQVGYRAVGLDLDDADGVYSDLEFNGLYAGLQVHF